ncbi:MAG: aldo/keto reductase [Hydrotalea sp.]|nr:aldo/keto reductase [Hydrotalea sp.]
MNKISLSKPIAGCMRWGNWGAQFSTSEYRWLIEQLVDEGITSFDHADIYGNYTTEADFGTALRGKNSLRENIQIITKTGICMPASSNSYITKHYNNSAKHIIESVENSLRNFHTDYLDVLLIHRPSPLMHAEELANTMYQLMKEGKVKTFGVSNFEAHHIRVLQKHIPIAYNQIEISLLYPKAVFSGILETCTELHITPMAWAPLGGGKVTDDTHPRYRAITKAVEPIAAKHGCSMNDVLMAWLYKHPAGILPILGSVKPHRLKQAQKAADILLSDEEWFHLLEAARGEEIA